MDTPITRAEHEEFRRRIEEENKRQNKRIDQLESDMTHMESMTLSIERLAVNMESMLKEQVAQGKRLEALESRDGENWRTFIKYVLTCVAGIVIGFLFKQIGL